MSDAHDAVLPGGTCPCGTGRPYDSCCGRFHAGPPFAACADAATLMRSRYSAFVLDRLDYLRSTWHPATCPAALEPHAPGLRWLGLEVRAHVEIDADHATVEFVARSKRNGRAHRLHEVSRFLREEGRWFYVDGDFLDRAPRSAPAARR